MMLIPILSAISREEARKNLDELKLINKRVRIEVADGQVGDEVAGGPSDFVEEDFGSMKVEYHLMVDDPTEWIRECVESGASIIIGQIERMGSQALFIDDVEENEGVKAGIALEYGTPVEEIEREILTRLQMIQLNYDVGKKDEISEKASKLREKYQGEIWLKEKGQSVSELFVLD